MDTDNITRELVKKKHLRLGRDHDECALREPYGRRMGSHDSICGASIIVVIPSHAEQLDDEVRRTAIAEVETDINSCPLPFPEMTQADIPLTPNQIPTQQTKQVLPLPVDISRQTFVAASDGAECRTPLTSSGPDGELVPALQERRRWTGTSLTCIRTGDGHLS